VHPTGFLNEGKPDEKTKMLCAELLRAVGGIILDSYGNRFVNEVGTRDHVVGKMKATVCIIIIIIIIIIIVIFFLNIIIIMIITTILAMMITTFATTCLG
jgi:hypothetical protein